jgi:5-(carboxyamino)imidazole ribonucleotide synthase
MLALAARSLGVGVVAIDPSAAAPAATVAEVWRGAYDDTALLDRMAEGASAVTFEFENVPPESLARLAEQRPVWPSPAALAAGRDRLREKALFASVGIPVPRHAAVEGRESLERALAAYGGRAVLKTRYGGFDGRGQAFLRGAVPDAAWEAFSGRPSMVEEVVPFRRELSAIAVRDAAGVVAFYPLVENHHEAGVLRVSIAPAPDVDPALEASVRAAVGRLLEHLGYVGVLALEIFETPSGWLANEMAPRVHNSGHWTIEGAETSQFENHLRAGLGWPLGSTAARGASAMINLLGDVPPHAALLSVPGARLHHYEKAARPARKLGHVTITAPDPPGLAERLRLVAEAIPALAAPARLAAGRLAGRGAAAP